MTTDVLLLGLFLGLTLIAYMIALNSHGSMKLIISYLMATLLLAGSVWAIVQYVNTGDDRKRQEEYSRLEREKQLAEERMRNQEQTLLENRKLMDAAVKINVVLTQGNTYAAAMVNIELKDFSVELEQLMTRANIMKTRVDSLVLHFQKLKNDVALFPECGPTITEALNRLSEATKYYRLYFHAEDSAQEEQREYILRQRAKEALDLFKKAGSQIVVKT